MKYLFLLLIFITHIGLAMSLKTFRNAILSDKDADEALTIAVERKKAKYPSITKEKIVDMILLPIAAHESDMTYDPKMKQYDGGPGRGAFQFEPDSMISALVRAERVFKDKKLPAYIKNSKEKYMHDASKLSAGQQAALLVYDFLEKPDADIGMVASDKPSMPITQFWRQYHWAGKKDRIVEKARIDSFNKHKLQYENDYSKQINQTRVRNIKQPPEKGNLEEVIYK